MRRASTRSPLERQQPRARDPGPGARRELNALLFLLFLLLSVPVYPAGAAPDSATLHNQIRESVGNLPWNPSAGYELDGDFIFKAFGDEIRYEAAYARQGGRWTAGFTTGDSTRNMRFALSGKSGWAASPELTADVEPRLLPFCAAYDFPVLYHELLRILAKGARDPAFRTASDGSEIYIRGRLSNGFQATFLVSGLDHFPRKVSIKADSGGPPAWFFLTREPDGSKSFALLRESPDGFQIWFSDPVEAEGYRYPARTDYVGASGVAGSFFLGREAPAQVKPAFLERPAESPWLADLTLVHRAEPRRPSLIVSERELPALRSRLGRDPWSGWADTNATAALWARVARRIAFLFPQAPSMTALSIGALVAIGGALVLARRRRIRFGIRTPRTMIVGVCAACILALLAGIASIELHDPSTRSLLALHAAIRYAVTGNESYAAAAGSILQDTPPNSGGKTEVLARACQANAAAYDLISSTLHRPDQIRIEAALFTAAQPLFAALRGYRSNTAAAGAICAGLGMTGLAIRCESYVTAAEQALEKMLREQVPGGLHRDGPGPGAAAWNAAADFMYALKRAGGRDYYADPAFRGFIQSTLELLSPVGTQPLFGETSLDAAPLVSLLRKVASHLPAVTGGQCMSACDSFSRYGRHSTTGIRKLVRGLVRPADLFFADPYVMFEHEREIKRAGLPAASAVLGGGQAAVLRSGTGPDSLFLALNAARSGAGRPRRDVLTFDVYAYRALLLHGAGFPGADHPRRQDANRTDASNSITISSAGQSESRSSGVLTALLNQPLFDQVRAAADRTYDAGQAQRDVVMVRPSGGLPGYFILVDEVQTYDKGAKVESYLHGRGRLSLGLNQLSRWICPVFDAPLFGASPIALDAFPAVSATMRSGAGKLMFEDPSLDQPSESLVIEWAGSKRFCTILYPHRQGSSEPRIEMLDKETGARIGNTDWISLSDPAVRRATGPVSHASEYAAVRDRGASFPGLLMVFGIECRVGGHSVVSDKPVSLSFDGLRGTISSSRPDTVVVIRTPEIRSGDSFLLDGEIVTAPEAGRLELRLARAGEHRLTNGVSS